MSVWWQFIVWLTWLTWWKCLKSVLSFIFCRCQRANCGVQSITGPHEGQTTIHIHNHLCFIWIMYVIQWRPGNLRNKNIRNRNTYSFLPGSQGISHLWVPGTHYIENLSTSLIVPLVCPLCVGTFMTLKCPTVGTYFALTQQHKGICGKR